jgi:hypothetical protein
MSKRLVNVDGVTFRDLQPVPEGGSRGYRVSFYNASGDAVSPNAGSIKWTLTDQAGGLINGREDQEIVSDDAVVVAIAGPDCAIIAGETDVLVDRLLTVVYEYDDSELGPGQPGRIEISFQVKNLVAIT